MKTPYDCLKDSYQKHFFFLLTIMNVVLIAVFVFLDQYLKNDVAVQGIISFELAGSQQQAKAIVSSWSSYSRNIAIFSLGLDYLFLFAYSLGLSFLCYLIATKHFSTNSFLYKSGVLISWLVLFAGVFDGVENYALLQILLFSDYAFWPIFAKYFATSKFIFLGLSVFYIVIGIFTTIKALFTSK